MEPTIAEMIFWVILGVAVLAIFAVAPFANPNYDPKDDDPYVGCPKYREETGG